MDRKRKVLEGIYAAYDAFIDTIDTACRRGCAVCCTQNMTLTTLEGLAVIDALAESGGSGWPQPWGNGSAAERFRPALTINEIARICVAGGEVPSENPPEHPAPCPLLRQDECSIYEVRPFGCRCMVSSRRCEGQGFADMPEWVLTVNQVFQQTIEHVDVPGCTGSLVDVLAFLSHDLYRRRYREGETGCREAGLAPNRRAPVLMVPPPHRERIRSILETLSGLDR